MTKEDEILFSNYYYANPVGKEISKELYDRILSFVLASKEFEDSKLLSLVVRPSEDKYYLSILYYNNEENRVATGYFKEYTVYINLFLNIERYTKEGIKNVELDENFTHLIGTSMWKRFSTFSDRKNFYRNIINMDDINIEEFKEEEAKLIRKRG